MKGIRLWGALCIIAVILGMGVFGCTSETPAETTQEPAETATQTEKQTLEIGICTPLTGPVANVGTNYQNGVLMAIEDQNAKGGVTIVGVNYELEAVIRDDKFDAATAQAIAEDMVYSRDIKVIFGSSMVETHAVQAVTNPNGVFLFAMSPSPDMCNPDLPYNFFSGGIPTQMYSTVLQYVKANYPEAKTVLSIFADMPDASVWFDASKEMCDYYGFDWIGSEQFPQTINDYSPVAQKIMASNPDIIDMSGSGGALGAVCGTIVKQFREEGFEGIIIQPTSPPPGIMNTVPQQYLDKIVTNDMNIDSELVTDAYRSLVIRYEENYGTLPIDMAGQAYNMASAFFKNIDGQETMDTSAWLESFMSAEWTGVFGEDARLIGSEIYGLDRCLITNVWASEWKDGVLVTDFTAEIPYELWRK